MPDILLTTLNAKYIHTAFGLRYLLANLGSLQRRAAILEFDINQRPTDIAEILLAQDPRIIGLGIYIWNVAPALELVAAIKRIRPEITIILGGPEVSYELESQPIVQLADHVITGEADLKFAEVCRILLEAPDELAPSPGGEGWGEGEPDIPPSAGYVSVKRVRASGRSLPKIIPADLPDFSRIQLPYALYSDEDIAHRIIYVEASRGCPFTCEFCLSSLDIPVRQVPLPSFLDHLQQLLNRGARQFKFVDRTFNLNAQTSQAILQFLLERYQPGHFYHFEMIPDRLPDALRELIAKFPPGALQFEVGVQTFNEEVGALIKRRQNYERLENNFRFLCSQTGVHVHADLIVGLPGESIESFGTGFDRLVALGPQEIQVGILKRLRGTPIVRHDDEWQMIYNPHPPYEILQNKLIDFTAMQKLRRFARYWDLIGNSGNFVQTCPLIFQSLPPFCSGSKGRPVLCSAFDEGGGAGTTSPFRSFMYWSDWLYAAIGRTDSIALVRLMELLFTFLTHELSLDPKTVAATLWDDYQRAGRHDKPGFLKDYLPGSLPAVSKRTEGPSLPKRQARHVLKD